MSNGTTWPGQQDCPVPILKTETGWASAFGPNVLGRWSGPEQDVVPTMLQWDVPVSAGSAFQGFIDGRFILGGLVSGATPKYGEFDAATGALLTKGDFGEIQNHGKESSLDDVQRRLTRWGAFTDTHKGLAGMLFADAHVAPTPVSEVWFDAFLRTNLEFPPLPPGTNPPAGFPWWFKRFKFPTALGTNSIGAMLMSAVQGSDGTLRVFVSRDSARVLGQAVFSVGDLGMSLVKWDERFIDEGQGDLSISGEMSNIYSVNDPTHKRILLAYQGQPDRIHPILKVGTRPFIMSRWSITEVQDDGTIKLLGVTPWWSSHPGFPKGCIFPRPDGIWFAFDCVEDDGSQHWKLGRFSDGMFQVMGRLPYGSVISYSKDGWLLFLDRSEPQNPHTDLLQVTFGPKLTITRRGDTVLVDWKPFVQGDMLQERFEGGPWQTPYVCVPPAILPLSSSSKTFRVVQNVPIES